MKPSAPKPRQPCSVHHTTRGVIEHKLLTALNDEHTVAILATRQDLESMIAALLNESGVAYCQTSDEEKKRRRDLADGMRQLVCEAFQ